MTNFFYFIHTNNHIKYKTILIKNFIKAIHSNCYKKLLKKNYNTNYFTGNYEIKYKTNLIKKLIKTIHSNCYKKLLKKIIIQIINLETTNLIQILKPQKANLKLYADKFKP